ALRDVNFDNDRIMEQWWAMNNARSLAELRYAVESIIGLPWVHAIATDRRGSVYYSDVTPVPYISDEQLEICVAPGFPATRIDGAYVLDGSRSACKWRSDRHAPQEGIVPIAKLPSLVRADYVQNSNDSAWQTNPAAPLTGFPTLVSQDGHELSGRARLGLNHIAARLAGRDGLSGNRFTLESLQAIAFSNRSMSATVLLDDLKTICPSAGASASIALEDGSEVDIAKGCGILARWDGTANLGSVGWPLYSAWRNALNVSGTDYYAVPFDPTDPLGTPRGLRIADAAVRVASLQAMAKAMLTLDAIGIDYTRPWGELQVFAGGGRTIPIHGGDDDDIYNAIASFEPGRNGRVEVDYGSSVIWTVSFETDPPIAQGFLTYSQSPDPTSPHFADQTQRFSDKDWITFPFTDEAIRADPEYTTRTIAE
ncbi:MAG TPA: penicillin acylase family protein, partial [Polyangiaceae bacterium]|nr:penicillin acylase family protein [Polyangiaceae bacterium]